MSDRRPGLGVPLLVAGALLIAAGVVVAFLPLTVCEREPYFLYSGELCEFCRGRGRVPLWRRWQEDRHPFVIWEGKRLEVIAAEGFEKTDRAKALRLAGIVTGKPFDNDQRLAAARALLATGCYEWVTVAGHVHPDTPLLSQVVVSVEEKRPLTQIPPELTSP